MSLAEKLEAIKAAGAKRIPPEKRAVMVSATQELRESGIMEGVPKAGDRLPEFALKNVHGVEVRSADLLAQGAVVLTVFRGSW
jgi:hypothetical protein